jgi:predicted O-methyltransferase YrrM
MANDQEPACKARIDQKAKKALEDLDKVLKAHPDLEVELIPVKEDVKVITQDNHHHL